VVKVGVHDGGGDVAGCFMIKIRADATKLTDNVTTRS